MSAGLASRDFNVALPRVTVVIINWNYAQYLGAAIQSVLAQDYPNIDCLIVDNGSTDASVAVAAKAIDGSPRFRILELGQNLGQLGALFEVMDRIEGDFVVLLDADDLLGQSFVSDHVQVHLALPKSVAFTSANVIEINAEGAASTGGYQAFGGALPWNALGLVDAGRTVRVPTVSDQRLTELSSRVSAVSPAQVGWFWSPGSANMYRRSALALVRQTRTPPAYMRAADAYLNPLCHALGGSALIDVPLSLYRLHDHNYFAARETLAGVRNGRPQFEALHRALADEIVDFVLGEAARFRPILGRERFWSLLDQISRTLADRPIDQSPAFAGSLARHLGALRTGLGDDELVAELPRKLRVGSFPALLAAARREGFSRPLQMRLVAGCARILSSRVSRRMAAQIPRSAGAGATVRPGGSSGPSLSREYGPVAVLSSDPPIFKCGIAYNAWVGIAGAYGRRFGNVPAGFLIYPTWSIESDERIAAIGKAVREHYGKFPNHRLVYLGNTQRETDMLVGEGLTAIFLNKNFTVSDTIFRPLAGMEPEFDAIYNARFAPEKRYELTDLIPRMAYLGYLMGDDEQERAAQLAMLNLLRHKYPQHVLLNPIVEGQPRRLTQAETNLAINRARVGLCLSEVEGTNYASMEYMLAGLGVVSTPSKGGRDVYFDPEFCIVCEPNASAVRDAVAELVARQIPREYIRGRALARVETERARFMNLVNDIKRQLGAPAEASGPWPFHALSGMVTWDRFDAHLERLKHPAAGVGPAA